MKDSYLHKTNIIFAFHIEKKIVFITFMLSCQIKHICIPTKILLFSVFSFSRVIVDSEGGWGRMVDSEFLPTTIETGRNRYLDLET